MPVRGRARGRFPLRAPAYQQKPRRRRPPAQPLAQTAAVGQAVETDATFAFAAAFSAGTDTFATSGALGAPWLAWTAGAGPASLTVSGGVARPTGTFGDASYPVSIGPGSFMEAVLSAPMQSGLSFGAAVRLTAHSSSADGYMMEVRDLGSGTEVVLYKGSGFTTLAGPTSPVTSSTVDAYRLTAVGTTIKGYLRISGVWTQVASTTDATYASAGYPGFWVQDPTAVGVGVDQVSWGPLAATLEATAGQASESDTAQVVRRVKTLPVGLATATNTALAVTARKTRAVGQAAETDAGLGATHLKTRAVGQAAGTETAQQLLGNIIRLIGQAAETETALSVTGANVYRTGAGRALPVGSRGRARGRYPLRGLPWQPPAVVSRSWPGSDTGRVLLTTVPVGQAVETDAALNLVTAPKIVAVGQAAEADTAFGVLRQRRFRSGFPYPVDTIIAGAFIVTTQVTDPQSALAVTRRKTRALGQAVEVTIAQSIGALGAKVITVGIAVETSTSQVLTRVKAKALGLTAGTQTAQPVAHTKARTPGMVVETGAAQTVRPARVKPVGQATETGTALAVTRVRSKATGQPLTFETAQTHRRLKTLAVGQAPETESARPVTPVGFDRIVVEQAVEAETVFAVARFKRRTIGLPQGNETSFTIVPFKTIAVGQASETDQVFSIVSNALLIRAIGIASDTGVARRIRTGDAVTYEPITSGGVWSPIPGTATGAQPGTANSRGVLIS